MTSAERSNVEPTVVERRWAESEERARAVSAQPPGAVLQVRWFVLAIVLVLVVLGVGAIVLPAGSDARFTLSAVVAGLGFVAGLSEAVQVSIRRRRNGVAARPVAVLAPLQQREQRAVTAAATGRRAAPTDRLAIVRARAVELTDGTGIQLTAGLVVVWAAVAFSGVTLWPVSTWRAASPRRGSSHGRHGPRCSPAGTSTPTLCTFATTTLVRGMVRLQADP